MSERPGANPVGMVYRAIRYRGAETAAAIVTDAGLTADMVEAHLARLVREGLIVVVGRDPTDAPRYGIATTTRTDEREAR